LVGSRFWLVHKLVTSFAGIISDKILGSSIKGKVKKKHFSRG
jgi:hypothetical protein